MVKIFLEFLVLPFGYLRSWSNVDTLDWLLMTDYWLFEEAEKKIWTQILDGIVSRQGAKAQSEDERKNFDTDSTARPLAATKKS